MAGADDLSLSVSYFPVTVTTPAGTAKASPLSTLVAVPPALLTCVDLLIPAGHAGQTGFRVVYSGQVILPFNGSDAVAWIVGDDDHTTFDLAFPVSTQLRIQTYNTGVFDHSHYVRFKVDYNAISAAGSRPTLTIVPSA